MTVTAGAHVCLPTPAGGAQVCSITGEPVVQLPLPFPPDPPPPATGTITVVQAAAQLAGRPLVRFDFKDMGSLPATAAPDLRDTRSWNSPTPTVFQLPDSPLLAMQRAHVYAQPFAVNNPDGSVAGTLNMAQAVVKLGAQYFCTPLGAANDDSTPLTWAALAFDGPTAAGFGHAIESVAALNPCVQAIVGAGKIIPITPEFAQALSGH